MAKYDYDVFIFYCRDDHSGAERLAERLANEGIKVFFEPWFLVPGLPRDEQPKLSAALQKSKTGIVFLGYRSLDPDYEELLNDAAYRMEIIIPVYNHPSSPEVQRKYSALYGRPGVSSRSERTFEQLISAITNTPLEKVSASRRLRQLEYSAELYYLSRIHLTNVRGFTCLDIQLDVPPGRQNIAIGRNGTCKTTLLRSIALVLAGGKDAPGLLSSSNGRWITSGKKEGEIRLHLEPVRGGESTTREVRIVEHNGGETVLSGEPAHDMVFACAYGTGRGDFGGEPGRDYRVMDSVATLFDYGERLVSSELVLRRLYDFLGSDRFDAVLSGLKKALGLGPEHSIELPRGGGVEISGPDLGGRIPLEAWADGYRMTFSWLIDFYGWAMRAGAFDDDGDVCGILLVDEIEQHLHPSMQREILGHLGNALPKVQIIATTHSPLVALSAKPEQIIALHRNGEGVHNVSVPSLNGYSAEDVLLEEALFGTSPYPPATEAQLSRYQDLAQIPPERRTPEQADELSKLARTLDPSSLPALRSDPVLAKLDAISARLSSEEPKS